MSSSVARSAVSESTTLAGRPGLRARTAGAGRRRGRDVHDLRVEAELLARSQEGIERRTADRHARQVAHIGLAGRPAELTRDVEQRRNSESTRGRADGGGRSNETERAVFEGSHRRLIGSGTLSIRLPEIGVNSIDYGELLTCAKGPLQLRHEVELFPREGAVLLRLAAEMAVRGGALVDRLVELQAAADVGRRSGKMSDSTFSSLRSSTLPVPSVFDIERHRIGDADRIGDLDQAAVGEAAATTFLAR
jgi:hypothetical protein